MRNVRAVMMSITLIALVVTCGAYLFLQEIRATPMQANEGVETEVEIEIKPGESTTQIATKLRAAGLIRQPILFVTLVRVKGLDSQLQSGQYVLKPSMTMSEILQALQYSRVEETQFTIPEGLRLEEIAQRIAGTGVVGEEEFLQVARNGALFRDEYFYLSSLPADASLEGYLFPDTYRIAATTMVTDIVHMMVQRFDDQYSKVEEVRVPDVSIHQIVTMASIVQREAALIEEMPTIAAVFWNRTKPEYIAETGSGRLEADPTVQYALGYSEDEQTWWRKDLTFTDLQIDSPYNTRKNAGLPPGPICSPGLEALRAAAQPDEGGEYLYFVASCEGDGSHNFATNFEEFRQYEDEYLKCSN